MKHYMVLQDPEAWRGYATSLPADCTAIGVISRGANDAGALCMRDGLYVQVNQAAIRPLDQALVRAALAAIERKLKRATRLPKRSAVKAPSASPRMDITYQDVTQKGCRMNFSIYLDDATEKKLRQLEKRKRVKRNALIRAAIEQFIEREGQPQWPDEILQFKGIKDWPAFEASRAELKAPADDPFA